MMHCLYAGATGIKTHGEGLSTVANNLANVNTIGYKQQSALFQDLMSQNLASPLAPTQGLSQLGMGSAVGDVRTVFTQGPFEPGSSMTDLALNGKGFFQVVSDDGVEHYTRAGNFRFDEQGYLRDPAGYTLSGIKMVNGQKSGTPSPIRIDMYDDAIATVPARVTSQITAVMNIGSSDDRCSTASDPYFSLLKSWNGQATPPLAEGSYSSSQGLTVYDASGKSHTVQIYFDGAPAVTQGKTTYEYVIGMNPGEDGSSAAGTAGAGLLMAGTLTFNSKGELVDMSAFTPDGGDKTDLASWTPATLANGLPQFTASFAGGGTQNITLDLGVQCASNSWTGAPASAAAVGAAGENLPTIVPVERDVSVTTARSGGSALYSFRQDGYPSGSIVNLNITPDGIVEAQYSNNTTASLYSIPVFRFTSEDGLRNEGMNHYSATPDSGVVEYGDAGTSNYGTIAARQLEASNVEMSREMVTMITVQRGFQMNSKVLTTADAMLQKALELKR